MSHSTDSRVLALHGLRLMGFATAHRLATAAGLDGENAERQLAALVNDGLVRHRQGPISGFSLTPAGRDEHARLLAGELARSGSRATIDHCYRRFLELNSGLLTLCTAWQVRDVGAKTAGFVDRLIRLDEHAQPVCSELGGALDRMARYGPQLRHARERVQAGDTDYFTAPMVASYHTVWFELHEDLLVTLGVPRAS